MESTGEMELALQYYEDAEDYLSLVRVYSYCEKLDKAAEIANLSGDKAACYHLARQYENIDNISEAIHFFSKVIMTFHFRMFFEILIRCENVGRQDDFANF